MASAWELAIKIRIEKITFNGGVERFFYKIDNSDIRLLPIRRAHIITLETLPLLHRDPFDRLLISAAIAENLTLITADENSTNTTCRGFGHNETTQPFSRCQTCRRRQTQCRYSGGKSRR